MPDFEDHKDVLAMLEKSIDAEREVRERVKRAHLFVEKEDGQWDVTRNSSTENDNQPRYTFDLVTPIIDVIADKLETADFNITVTPSGGNATKEDAKLFDGIIRNIENISGANHTFNTAGKNMIIGGIDGWQLKQEFVDGDSFDQDLVIKPVANYLASVWFGPYKQQDASDASYGFVLEAVDPEDYEKRWPEGRKMSVGGVEYYQAYHEGTDDIIIGNIYYLREEERVLLKTNLGRVFEESEMANVVDEMEARGESVIARRKRVKKIAVSRLFDGGGWLSKAQDTVFDQVPLIPVIANFKILENKVQYRGAVQKLMDPQMVFNTMKTRQVVESAYAPRAKYWLTEKQALGHTETLATLNTNSDPVQIYNSDSSVPGPPQQQGGSILNTGLEAIGQNMQELIQKQGGIFAANLGDQPGATSGIAIKRLQEQGNAGSNKFLSAHELAIRRTAKMLINAIPRTYTGERQMRIMKEDGGFEEVIVNREIFDVQTKSTVTLNDLTIGKYDVAVKAGPSYANRQEETVEGMLNLAAIDPDVLTIGGDILFNNMTSPGMDLIAERKRRKLVIAGEIPDEQLTEEEQQLVAVLRNQPPPPDPNMVLAQAEQAKADAKELEVVVKAETQQRVQDREDVVAQARIEAQGEEIAIKRNDSEFRQIIEMQQAQLQNQQAMINALKTLKESIGADIVEDPNVLEAFRRIAQEVKEEA